MGIFDVFRKKKLTADISFDPIPPREHITVETAAGVMEDPTAAELETNLRIMLEDASGFLTLTPVQAVGGIRYMQACRIPEGVNVQLGLEKEGRIRLVEKAVDEETALRLFRSYFCGKTDIDIGGYAPVKFMKR